MKYSCLRILICLGTLILARIAGAQTCTTPPSGIISWWPFDEISGATVTDIVGNHEGHIVNSPSQAAGKVDNALRFNGSTSYVTVNDSDLWAFGSSDFTIEFWANFSSLPSSVYQAVFVGNDEGPGIRNKWFFTLALGNLQFAINGPSVGSQSFPWVPFTPAIGQWYHLAVTRNGDTYTIYINGSPSGSAINASSIPNPNAPLTIGQAEGLGYMPGLLDEVTIYYRALSHAELQAIVAAGSAGKCKQSQSYANAYFPQVAIGGGYSTLFTIANTGEATATGNLYLKDPNGNSLPAHFELTDSSGATLPVSAGSSAAFQIPTAGIIFLSATGLNSSSSVKIGWADLESTGGSLTAVATYEYVDGEGLQARVGVLDSQPLQFATVPVDFDVAEGKQLVYALSNPNDQTISVKLALVGQDGTVVDDSIAITLLPGQQVANYLSQETGRSDFKGSMVLRGQNNATFVAVALEYKQNLVTLIPLISGKAPGIPK
jgi:hypothetical protein